ncbi:MAG: ParA family protein [Crocosphaera sp.]|nr:ParA family protein [Crocosphaera sp.]
MQVRLAIISNAGGSGKSTLAVHLAYAVARYKYKVALMDLDPQGTITLFCGLPSPEPNETLSAVLKEDFKGNWPLMSCWKDKTDYVSVCQGGMTLTQTADELVLHKRGAYLLEDCLLDYPLSHDLVIFDCPATLGPLVLIALTACTHILVPVQVEPKSIQGSARLLEWYYFHCRYLRLQPYPEILGFVPNQYDKRRAAHRQILLALPHQLESMKIPIFDAGRESSEFVHASGVGFPLQIYRPAHPANRDFTPIVSNLVNLIKKEN